MASEFATKVARVHGLLRRRSARGVWLRTRANFAWLSCGGTNHVRQDTREGVAAFCVTRSSVEVWTDAIEAPRIAREELARIPAALRPELVVRPWHEPLRPAPGVLSDDGSPDTEPASDDIAALRWSLLPQERARYRRLGRLAGAAVREVALGLAPGMTELEVAGRLAASLQHRGCQASVVLVGADERIERYRHPVPTSRRIERVVMLVVCAQRAGLVASLTRLVHFGRIPDDLQARHRACCRVEARLWSASAPGRTAGDVLAAGIEEYARAGFADEWRKHHQGGPCGYEPRDYIATPGETPEARRVAGPRMEPVDHRGEERGHDPARGRSDV